MQIEFKVQNYRSFSDSSPLRFRVAPGNTAFVGPNNAGKSTALRFLFEFRHYFQSFTTTSFINSIGGQGGMNPSPGIKDRRQYYHKFNDRPLRLEMRLRFGPDDAPPPLPTPLPAVTRIISTFARHSLTYETRLFSDDDELHRPGDNTQERRGVIRGDSGEFADFRAFQAAARLLQDSLYVGSFRNALNIGEQQTYFDIQTGQAFIKEWRKLKSGPDAASNEVAHQITAVIADIFGFRTLEINPTPEADDLQLTIDGKSFRLAEVGSGIAQFFLVLATAAVRKPSIALIDEPELSLHPALQPRLLETLATHTSFGVLYATHSLGLARGYADTIYSVRRPDPTGPSIMSNYSESAPLVQFLGEMGFAALREVGVDRILLVEGTTDVRVHQQYLQKLGLRSRVVVLPLGGGAMVNSGISHELSEMLSITSDVVAVVDSDRTANDADPAAAPTAFHAVCRSLNIECHLTELRATENYFPDDVVKQVLGTSYRALGPYEAFAELSPRWGKSENWRMAALMTPGQVRATDVGNFLLNAWS